MKLNDLRMFVLFGILMLTVLVIGSCGGDNSDNPPDTQSTSAVWDNSNWDNAKWSQ